MCGACGWASAQVIKTIIYAWMHKGIHWERLVGDGGMPSGHSATVSAMASASAFVYGFSSFEFAVTCMLAIIVMHDAMGVRMETGRQGKVLNEMIDFFRTEGFVEAFKNLTCPYPEEGQLGQKDGNEGKLGSIVMLLPG